MSHLNHSISPLWLVPGDDLSDCFQLRTEVFVEEQKFEEEFDAIDPIADHLLLFDRNVPVATARIFKENDWWMIGRICVKRSYRGKQLGRQVLSLAEKRIRDEGGTKAALNAQTRAQLFYERCGYHSVGDVFFEEYCEHIRMEKRLEEVTL